MAAEMGGFELDRETVVRTLGDEMLLDNLARFVQAELVKHLMGNIGDRGERRLVTASFALGCTARISARLNALVEQSAKLTPPPPATPPAAPKPKAPVAPPPSAEA